MRFKRLSFLMAILCLCLIIVENKAIYAQKTTIPWVGVVIHHTATHYNLTKEKCDEVHKKRGWDECGYNFVIGFSGKVEEARGLDRHGAHALNPAPSRNRTHIGIAVSGHSEFTSFQYEALRKLLLTLSRRFGTLKIEHHHEDCPGHGFKWQGIK